MKKVVLLAAVVPLLMSAAPTYTYFSNVFNYTFVNVPSSLIQTGKESGQLLSDANSAIANVDLTYEVRKLGFYSPYIEKHQTYHFAYKITLTLLGDGVYKNGLFNLFTANSNALLYQEPRTDVSNRFFRALNVGVSFNSEVGDSVFYNLLESYYDGKIVGRAWDTLENSEFDPSYSGNYGNKYSAMYTWFRKYLDKDRLGDKNTLASLSNEDLETFYQKIQAYYSKETSESDYSIDYYLKEESGFQEGVSDYLLQVDPNERKDISFNFYDQFCVDSYNLGDSMTVTLDPNFTLRLGNNSNPIGDPYEYYDFTDEFNIEIDFK